MVKSITKQSDIDQRYDYVLDYINESARSREGLKAICERVVRAYKKEPYINTYKQNAQSFYKIYSSDPSSDKVICKYIKASCDSIPDAKNDTVFNAVETVVSMAQGGIGQFEYKPYDQYLEKDAELADMQSAFLQSIYDNNHLDGIASSTVRKAMMQGQFNWIIKPLADGKFKVSLIDAYKMLQDPRSSKSNMSRYIGYQEVSSWTGVKEYLDTIKKNGDIMVKTVNNVDMYLNELRNWSPSSASNAIWSSEISEDLDTFANIYSSSNIRQSKSVTKNGDDTGNPIDDAGYKGDDVEVSYVWDLVSDIYFVVINRRFIVYKADKPLQKIVKIKTTYCDLETGDIKTKYIDYVVKIDSPIVHRGYIDADWETYPVSPLFYCLDDFDNICSKESVLEHNLSIIAPITFLSTAYDAEKISGISQVAGQIVEGTQNSIQVLNKTYDMSSTIAAIQRSEERIKRMLGATDQFELMALLNNRATGAEVSMANGAVSQRMNILLSRLEDGYSDLSRKLLAMQIIYADSDDQVFTFPYKDGVASLTQEDIAGDSLIKVKLASRIKVEQQEQSQNALMVLQTLAPLAQYGVDIKRVISQLVPIITQNVVGRRVAESFVDDTLKIDPARLNAAINSVEKEREKQSASGPLTNDMIAGMSLDNINELEQLVASSLGGQPSGQNNFAMPNTDINEQSIPEYNPVESSMLNSSTSPDSLPQLPQASDGSPIPMGMPPDMAGRVANQNLDLGAM